jgi:hypothetical protein
MDELNRLIELLKQAIVDLKKQGDILEALAKIDATEIGALKKAQKALLDRLAETQAVIGKELAESIDVAGRIDPQPGEPPAAVLATDLAKGFRSVIQQIQSEVDDEDADVGTIIRSMDVELKGHIVVADKQPSIVPPAPGQNIDADQLSTIRMSFASVPRQRAERKPG